MHELYRTSRVLVARAAEIPCAACVQLARGARARNHRTNSRRSDRTAAALNVDAIVDAAAYLIRLWPATMMRGAISPWPLA